MKPKEPIAEPASPVVVDVTDTALAPVPARRPREPSPPAPRSAPPARTAPPPRAVPSEPPTETPAPAIAVAPAPEPTLSPAPAIAPALEPTLAAAPSDDEPLRDTTMTIRAMRLLNMRVAELDAAVRKLQSDLDEHRSGDEKRA